MNLHLNKEIIQRQLLLLLPARTVVMPSSQQMPPQRRSASLPRQAVPQTNGPEKNKQQTPLSASRNRRDVPNSSPEAEADPGPLKPSSSKHRPTTSSRTLCCNEADRDEALQPRALRRDERGHAKKRSRKELEEEVSKLKGTRHLSEKLVGSTHTDPGPC